MRVRAAAFALLIGTVAACQSPAPTAAPGSVATPVSTAAPSSEPTAAGSPPATVEPSSSPGFAFDPESIVDYYRTQGYVCDNRQPSKQAAGFEFQSCHLVDPDGRSRTLGFVTDPEDNLADAFLTIRGTDAETILDPAASLDAFAGFLGSVLGEAHGTEMLPWLAGHLGDRDSRTTLGELTIATYTPSPDEHDTLTLEIANASYLAAPRPS
jgi:hypothetical protein